MQRRSADTARRNTDMMGYRCRGTIGVVRQNNIKIGSAQQPAVATAQYVVHNSL